MIVIVATVYISANRRPSAAIAWVLAIVFIPYLGALAYLFVGVGVGVGKLPESRRRKQRQVNELMLNRTPGLAQVSHRDEWPAWLPSAAQLNLNLGALPMVGGNRAELFPDYQGSIDAMTREIDTATEFVHVQFYIQAGHTASLADGSPACHHERHLYSARPAPHWRGPDRPARLAGSGLGGASGVSGVSGVMGDGCRRRPEPRGTPPHKWGTET